MNEIRNALNAGREVITHTDAVSVPRWSGAGYIITDPKTGDGAYKISGGGNGSFFFGGQVFSTLLFAVLLPFLPALSVLTGFIGFFLLILSLAIILAKIATLVTSDGFDLNCFFSGILEFAGISAFIVGLYSVIRSKSLSKFIVFGVTIEGAIERWAGYSMPSPGECTGL